MKTLFSKKKLVLISLFFIFSNSCMAENKSLWKNVDSNKNKEDCVDCYSDLDFDKKNPKVLKNQKEIVYNFNDTSNEYKIDSNEKAIEFKDKIYVENKNISKIKKTIAIQIGAFRQYSGAKKYVKKYAILSSEYKVTIKAGAKNQKPLYRVQIEGFSSKNKAEEFKKKYGLNGAFLVMK